MFRENRTIGILGGGQLGKMILDVSNRWGLKVFVLDSNIECPSSKLCSKFFVGDLMDYDSVVQFGENVDLITIEIENVNVDALKFLESKGKKVFPQPRVIEIIQDKSKQVGFEWDTTAQVQAKVMEELAELNEAMEENNQDHIEEEFGDVLFSLVNLARFLNVDPELALERTNRKFMDRFNKMEIIAEENEKSLLDMNLVEMDALWNFVKSKR